MRRPRCAAEAARAAEEARAKLRPKACGRLWGNRMALLDEYHRKRDFKKTPEPRGETPVETGGFSFCVQKHAATRLHYDFRLELDGVLKSWAVPKGPAYDMAEKRLAMRTEDHPLEYGGFEGIIPAGEYGGGAVLLWDHGTWEPLEDPHAGMLKGALKFRLHGRKLVGAWALVKIKSREARDAEKTWLLIKERDAAIRPLARYDVTEARPESVVSGRELEEIARDKDRVWHSTVVEGKSRVREPKLPKAAPPPPPIPGARKAALPRFVEPQLATPAQRAPEGDEWLHELKFDGYRIQARKDGDEVQLRTRNRNDWTATFARLAEAVGRLPCRQALVDGEAAVLRPDGTTSFNALQNAIEAKSHAQLVYLAFDLIHLDGQDLTRAPLEERKAALRRLIERAGPAGEPIQFSDHVTGSGPAFFESVAARSLEGIVSKRRDSLYLPGRGGSWLKVKCVREQELVVVGFTEPEGSREGLGALVLAVHQDGELAYAGRVGSGFDARTARELRQRLDAMTVEQPALARPPALKKAHWVEPRLLAQVRFAEWTPDGQLRHPSFKGLREDKPASEVVREGPGPAAASPPKDRDTIGGVRMTHPERVLYPASGFTKRQLAEYYLEIADWILPHLKGRPTSLVRCPEGVDKECFYQKHSETAPPELRRVSIEERKKAAEYLVAEDAAGLVALAQMSILEIHTWNCRYRTLEQPDRVVIDLDPAEDLPWQRVVDGARLVRERLTALELASFVKTTGGKGLHVVVPFQLGPSWDQALAFSQALALLISRERPKEYLAVMTKSRRVGRIYLDYLRNRRGSTSICAYSTRAVPAAPVSVPLHWDELDGGTRPDFNVANVPARLRTLRQDPWQGYAELEQRLPV